MTREEMQALRDMMREEIGTAIQPITKQLDGVEQRLGGVEQRIGGLDQRLSGMEQCIDGLDQRLGGVEQRIGGLDQRLGGVEQRMEGLETDVRYTRVLVEKQQHQIQVIAEQYGDIAAKSDKANDRAAQMDDLRERLRTAELTIMQHTAILQGLAKAQ